MRKGYSPKLLIDKKGNIFAIATGSDACAEHECGSNPLQFSLCKDFAGKDSSLERELIEQIRKSEAPGLLSKAFNLPQKQVQFPNILAQKVINKNLDHIRFIEGVDSRLKKPAAVLWFTDRFIDIDVNYRELAMNDKDEVAGAWDDRGFAFKVVGEKLVSKLKVFAEKLREGQGCFAGLFLNETHKTRLSGVIVALHTQLRPEHKAAVILAQKAYEDGMLLKARSRLDELHATAYPKGTRAAHLRTPGYMWPVWRDGVVGGEVLYALNPDYGINAPYWGPYSFEQLKRWIEAEEKFALVPVPHRQEEAVGN